MGVAESGSVGCINGGAYLKCCIEARGRGVSTRTRAEAIRIVELDNSMSKVWL